MNRFPMLAIMLLALLTGCQSPAPVASMGTPTPAQVARAMNTYRQAHPARCEVCGKPASADRVLEVHHKKPREAFPTLAATPGNLILVCRNCHMWVCHPGDFGKYTDQLDKWLDARKIKENKP